MANAAEIRRHKRRSNRSVFVGVAVMAIALVVSSLNLVPELATTIAGIAGFVSVVYGVHVGWLVFYEREPDGPAS